MCMGFAKDIKDWVCMTEQNERDAMLQAWADTFAQQQTPAWPVPQAPMAAPAEVVSGTPQPVAR